MVKNDYVSKMVQDAVKQKNEIVGQMDYKEAILLKRVQGVMGRVVDFDDIDDYTAKKLALIYNNLAPDDISHAISAKMVMDFMESVVKVENPEFYEKIWRYYDYENPLPEKVMRKLGISVENLWNRYRTVEYCYKYSMGFRDFTDKYASKVDAGDLTLSNTQKIKWLRLWLFIIKDQGFFWTDIKGKGTINVSEQMKFDREIYLFPNTMLYLEPYVSKLQEKSLNVELLRRFINLYPEDVQRKVYRWGEMTETNHEPNILRAGEVRMEIKKALFPEAWMSSMSQFVINIKDNNPKYLESAVIAFKDGGVENLKILRQKGTDPFDKFKTKVFNSYEIYSTLKDGVKKVLVVINQKELEMYVQVYEWLLEHPNFKFGPEDKTLAEYGINHLLDEEPEFTSEWFVEMGLVNSEEDINWEVFKKVADEEFINQYLKGEISGEELFQSIGFVSDVQAKFCCNKRVKLIKRDMEKFLSKMSEALKRLKMFKCQSAIKSDIIYLEIFKYMVDERPEELTKTMINLYKKEFVG